MFLEEGGVEGHVFFIEHLLNYEKGFVQCDVLDLCQYELVGLGAIGQQSQ